MKKNLFFSLGVMLLLSACSNDMKDAVDNVPVPQSGLQYMEFTASAGTDTRTELTSDNKVVWQDGDEISIFDGTGNRKFTTKDGGASAVFGGNAASADNYYALYPYQEGATLEGNVIKNVTLPSEQTAKAGSFDVPYNLSVAKASSDLQLAFKNVGSLVKFAVSNDQAANVRKVKLTSYDNTAVLTGTVDITLGSQPAVTSSSGQQPFATLIADDGLETGKYYYFAVLPSELSTGFSLTFFDEQGNTWQKDYTKEANLNRSNILKLAAIEVGAFTNSLLTNANLIAAAEKSTGRTFTKNADGSVSLLNDDNYQIAMAVTRLNVRDKGDSSVCDEIGVFSNLEYLDCCVNEITYLDLSKNTALTYLNLGANQLTNLDISKNTALTELGCAFNQLTSLDLSKNSALTELHCDHNQLTSLDLTNNTALTMLNCSFNQLASLDLTNNTALTGLHCAWNQLTSLDLSKNTALAELHCDVNQLTSLDLTNNTALTTINCGSNLLASIDLSKNNALTNLACHNNQLTSLDLTKNTALTSLGCDWNQLTNLDLSKNTSLTYLDCNSNQLTSLDLTNNTALTTCLNCHSNHLKSLDISNHNQLDWGNLYVGIQTDSTTGEDQELTLYVNADQISQGLQDPDGMNKNVNKLLKSDLLLTNANLIAAAEASTGRTFTKNANGSVSLSNDDNYQIAMAVTRIDVSYKEDLSVCEEIGVFSNLEYLNCNGNGIAELDLSNNIALTELYCDNNQLTYLNLSNNTALTELRCYDNKLTSLDLSNNSSLTGLSCGHNLLTNLNMTNHSALTHLWCANNKLTNLTLAKHTALTSLVCENNQLTNIDVSNCAALSEFYCSLNQLTSLNLSNNTALDYLQCCRNQLTSLDISNNNQINWGSLLVGNQTNSTGEDQNLNLYVNSDQLSQPLSDTEENKNVFRFLKE